MRRVSPVNSDSHTYSYAYDDCQPITDSNRDSYRYVHDHTQRYAHSNSYNDSKGHTDPQVSPKSEVSSDAAPSPVSGS